MTMEARTGVVVGVDGSERAHLAARYAAREARRLELPLTVVHVHPDYVPVAPMMPLIPGDLREIGRQLLAEGVREASAAEPDVEVSSLLLSGHPASELVRACVDARLLVLGHESTSVVTRVFTGAVATGVAARAGCPVVSVPADWQERTHGPHRIVLGYGSADHDTALLEEGFRTASAHDAHLSVLHAWELPGCYDDIIVRRTHDDDWNAAALERIENELADLRADHPDVEVDVRVVHRQPALALREASRQADLLMLARRADGHAPVHLGGTARALLREAACPVEIVPQRRRSAETDEAHSYERSGAH